MLTGNKLIAAKNAARTFISVTDLAEHRIGVVGFHGDASLVQGLTASEADLGRAIDNLAIDTGTNIADAIDIAAAELAANGRPEALGVIILITGGSPNRPVNDPSGSAVRAANSAKIIQKAEIYAVGLGSDVDDTLLKSLVTAPENYYFAPDNSELEIVYRSIAEVVGNFSVRNLVLDDELPPEVTLAPGTVVPSASAVGRTLRWTHALVPEAGLQWVYTITPTVAGTYPTNVSATASFDASEATRDTVVFPVPTITVLEPEPEPVCSLPQSWTVMVHSFPDATGVSNAGRTGCNNTFDSGDWFGGTRMDLPMLQYRLASQEGTVLFEGGSVPSAGRVDQWLYIRVCEPPPYVLSLLNADLGPYEPCPNSPTTRTITRRNFRPEVFHRTEERFGFVR
jgi:hypothetical protein